MAKCSNNKKKKKMKKKVGAESFRTMQSKLTQIVIKKRERINKRKIMH